MTKGKDKKQKVKCRRQFLPFTFYLSSVYLLLLVVIGCGPEHEFKRAVVFRQKKHYIRSAVAFEKFHKKYPNHKLAPLALLNSAELYNYKLKLPSKAALLYHRILSEYSHSSEFVEKAKNGLVSSPDYFPLKNNSVWIEGDSATGGSNMKAEWKLTEISTGVFFMSKKIMSGGKVVAQTKHYFKYDGYSILEMSSQKNKHNWIFLQYPFMPDRRWRVAGKGGRSATLWIDGVGLKVKVVAGNFEDCIRVAKRFDDMPAAIKYNYYAPYVGWVLTSILSGGREYRNSELLSYKISE